MHEKMKPLYTILSIIIASTAVAQTVRVPLSVDVPVYNDAAIVQRLSAIEARLSALENASPDPQPDPEPTPDPDPTPNPEPIPIDTSAFFQSLVASPLHLASFDYGSQSEIDSRSVNPDAGAGSGNENLIYDATMDAARIEVAGGIQLWNRCAVHFPVTDRGHLAFVWEYHPSNDWESNNVTVNTQKMFMIGNSTINERHELEVRFHYYRTDGLDGVETGQGHGDGLWQVDTRGYNVGADLDGVGSGLDRVTPWQPQYAKVGQWNRFYADISFQSSTPRYTLFLRTADGELLEVTRDAPLSTLVSNKGGCEFFDPTWCITSQSANSSTLTHGWLRNVVVLHSDGVIDMDSIRAVPISEGN